MVRHIVCWSFGEGFTEEENKQHAKIIKEGLENLKDKIEGIVSITVCTQLLETSSCDVMLNCLFTSSEALDLYQVHEEHVKVASFIKRVMTNRYCIDYIEN